MGSALGVEKTAARRIGVTHEAYRLRLAQGELWCTNCKAWHPREAFGSDVTRKCKKDAHCRQSRSTGNPIGWHGRPSINPLTGKPGPAPGTRMNRRG